jgi:hypothetical protein
MGVLLPVSTGVSILRVVATADRTAHETGSEMNPGITQSDAAFANV